MCREEVDTVLIIWKPHLSGHRSPLGGGGGRKGASQTSAVMFIPGSQVVQDAPQYGFVVASNTPHPGSVVVPNRPYYLMLPVPWSWLSR